MPDRPVGQSQGPLDAIRAWLEEMRLAGAKWECGEDNHRLPMGDPADTPWCWEYMPDWRPFGYRIVLPDGTYPIGPPHTRRGEAANREAQAPLPASVSATPEGSQRGPSGA